MSLLSHLSKTRLWWNGSRGIAACEGVERSLSSRPDVDGVELEQIDFAPELGCYRIRRHSFDKEEDMQPPEIVAVRRWLHCFAQAVKRELGM